MIEQAAAARPMTSKESPYRLSRHGMVRTADRALLPPPAPSAARNGFRRLLLMDVLNLLKALACVHRPRNPHARRLGLLVPCMVIAAGCYVPLRTSAIPAVQLSDTYRTP